MVLINRYFFTNTEEAIFGRSDNVPYKLETRLAELGANLHSALVPFLSHVEVYGVLVIGQSFIDRTGGQGAD